MSKSEFPIESIDPVVSGLLPGYLARREAELGRLQDLLASGSFAEIKLLGHNLSGSGGAYGLPELTHIGRRIEDAAGDADAPALQAELKRLEGVLLRVRAAVA